MRLTLYTERTSGRRTPPRRPARRHPALLLAVAFLYLSAAHARRPTTAAAAGVLPVELTAGAPAASEVAAGEVAAFVVALGASQLLPLVLEKGDLRVAVTVYAPDGRMLFEQSSHGYETLETALMSESAGVYKLEVRSLEREGAGRSFELKVGTAREATARDAQYAAARAAAAEAGRLRADWAQASLRAAAEKYAEASRLWRSAREARGAASALAGAAEVHFVLGEYIQALGHYRQAAAESVRAGDGQAEAQALCQVGRLHSYLGDNDLALKYLKRGLSYYTRDRPAQGPALKQSHASALSIVGEVYYSKGDLLKASEQLTRSLDIFAEGGDRGGEARARLFRGYVLATIGEHEKAVGEFNRALGLYRATANRGGEALTLTALGTIHSHKRGEDAALHLHREAMSIFRVIGDTQSEAVTLNAVGQSYQNLHEYELALENYRQALKLFQANGSLDLAAASVYQIASVYRLKGQDEEALAQLKLCVRLSRSARKRRMEAYALKDAAAIYAAQGKGQQTLAQYREILNFYGAVGDPRGQALTLNDMGDFFLSRAEAGKALASYRRALPLGRRVGDWGVEVSTLYNVARAARAGGDIEEALSSVERSINIVESVRANVGSPESRTSYFAGAHGHYELYIELLMEMERRRPGRGFAAAALKASESARARSLLEILTEAGTDIRRGVDPAVLERERELRQMLRAQAEYRLALAGDGRATEETEEAARGLELLKAQYREVQAQIRSQDLRQSVLTQASPLEPEEIQAELRGGDMLLLQYALGAERSYLWAVTRDSISSHALPPRATLEKAARELYEALTARQTAGKRPDERYMERVEEADRLYYAKASELSRMLLGPVAERLGEKRLLVVTEGLLQYVPFDALPEPSAAAAAADGGGHSGLPLLVSRHEIVSLPSVSILAALRRERTPRQKPGGDLVAVLADPVFSRHDERVAGVRPPGDAPQGADSELAQRAVRGFDELTGAGELSRLSHTSGEADAILDAAPSGTATAAKGFEASRETATGPRVGGARIVHFATHGFINSERPELSGIVLSMTNKEGGRENGFLSLQDIYNLNLSADLVVLSACETGLGKDVKGEGLIGLTRGFMYAGSKSVVASLWKVDDRATAELMGHFYRGGLRGGMTPAAALRSAKEALRRQKRWSAPYFWAGFVLQGEYEGAIEVPKAVRPDVRMAAVPALVLLAAALLFLLRRRRMHWAGQSPAPDSPSGAPPTG